MAEEGLTQCWEPAKDRREEGRPGDSSSDEAPWGAGQRNHEKGSLLKS